MKDYSNIQPGVYVDNVDDPLVVGPYGRSSWGDQRFIDALEVVLVDKRGWETTQIEEKWDLTFALPLEFVE